MSQARANILAKLREQRVTPIAHADVSAYYQTMGKTWDNGIERLRHWAATMRSVKTDIVWVHRHNWLDKLGEQLRLKNIQHLLLPHQTDASGQIADYLSHHAPTIQTQTMSQAIEHCHDLVFDTADAGFTEIKAGIAQTGTLVLWPTAQEPRSLSLVPPIHIALFDTATLCNDFHSAMQHLNMADAMPSNVVLISGPSKTADIQLTLAYGAHGPKDLIVLALLPDDMHITDIEKDGQ